MTNLESKNTNSSNFSSSPWDASRSWSYITQLWVSLPRSWAKYLLLLKFQSSSRAITQLWSCIPWSWVSLPQSWVKDLSTLQISSNPHEHLHNHEHTILAHNHLSPLIVKSLVILTTYTIIIIKSCLLVISQGVQASTVQVSSWWSPQSWPWLIHS